MNFREFVTESLSGKSLQELEMLLKNADSDADVKKIKAAISKLKSKKTVQTPGNQDLGGADSISIGGSGNMAGASPDGAGPGQGNAE
jgi:vacuolar-type H+-ATPase subunit E/Vma4